MVSFPYMDCIIFQRTAPMLKTVDTTNRNTDKTKARTIIRVPIFHESILQ